MYTLYTDKRENFECTIEVEGASLNESSARVVLENSNLNLLFKGRIDESGNCIIPIKQLKNILPEGTEGKIKLEVISDDVLTTPWEDDFLVKASKKVTAEVKSGLNKPTIKDSKVKVNVSTGKDQLPKVNESSAKQKNHASVITEVLSKKGVTIDNIGSYQKSVRKIVESYIKRNKLKYSADDLMSEIIINLI